MDKQNKQVFAPMLSFSASTNDNTPKFAESRLKWIPYGVDNLYNEYLVDLLNTSSKHNSLVKKTVNMVAGNGFEIPSDPTALAFINNSNGSNDLNDIAFKNAYDLKTYGGCYFIATWSNDKKTVSRLTFLDWSKVRVAKILEDGSEMAELQSKGVDFYYISSDWSNVRKNPPELIQGFSEIYKENATQIFSINEYRVGVEYYALPDYISSVDWIELDKEIANFHLKSVQNGFTPSMMLSFKNGVPSEEEMKKERANVKKAYGGTDNASDVFVTFSESGADAPELTPINLNTSDDRFLNLEQQIQQNIVIAHGATPIVAGIATAGKLGSSDEIEESVSMFQENVIESKQTLLERAYNKVLSINGGKEKIKLKKYNYADKQSVIS